MTPSTNVDIVVFKQLSKEFPAVDLQRLDFLILTADGNYNPDTGSHITDLSAAYQIENKLKQVRKLLEIEASLGPNIMGISNICSSGRIIDINKLNK